MSAIGLRIAPRAGFEPVFGGTQTDPFLSVFGIDEPVDLRTDFAKQNDAALEQAVKTGTRKAQEQSVSLGLSIGKFVNDFFGGENKGRSLDDRKKNKPAASPPSAPSPGSGGRGDSGATSGGSRGRPARFSDFKTAAKIAATGAAATGAGLGINEAAKQLSDTTGKIAENAAESIGKGADAVTESLRDTLQPIYSLLGITDPQTQKSIASLLLVGGIVGASLLVLYFVVKKK